MSARPADARVARDPVCTIPPAEDPGPAFGLVYATIAIGVSAGGAVYLFRNRHRLR